MLAKISRFLEAVATGLTAPAVDAESWRTVLTSVAAAIPTRVTATYVQPAELRKTLAAGPFVETTTDSGIRQFLDQTGHVVAEADGAGYLSIEEVTMTDTTMAELLATAKLGFEINTQPNPELDCTLCGGRLDGIFGDNRWVPPSP